MFANGAVRPLLLDVRDRAAACDGLALLAAVLGVAGQISMYSPVLAVEEVLSESVRARQRGESGGLLAGRASITGQSETSRASSFGNGARVDAQLRDGAAVEVAVFAVAADAQRRIGAEVARETAC